MTDLPMPIGNKTQAFLVTTSSATKTLPASSGSNLIIKNGGASAVLINTVAASTATSDAFPATDAAVANGAVILPGEVSSYRKNDPTHNYLTVIGAGSSTIYVQTGEGV